MDNPDSVGLAEVMAYHMSRRNLKQQRKTKKKFAVSLLNSAACSEWEEHEIAKLMCLLAENMGLSNKKLLRLLNKTAILSAELMACLSDNGVNIRAQDAMKHLKNSSNSVESLLANLDKSLEQGILCSHDVEALAEIRDFIEQEKLSHSNLKHIVVTCCSHSDSLRQCGMILNTFCDKMLSPVALSLAQDVMSMEFVHGLDGVVDDFFEELSSLGQEFEESLRDVLEVNQYGKLIPADSDADEEGNLRGFVEDDDVIRYDGNAADYQVHSENSFTSSDIGDSSDSEYSSGSSMEEVLSSHATERVTVSTSASTMFSALAEPSHPDSTTELPVALCRVTSPSDEDDEFDAVIPTKGRRSSTARSSRSWKRQRTSSRVIIDESESSLD